MRIILLATAVIVATVLSLYKEFVFSSFDEEMAMVCGVPVRALRYLLLVMIALAVVVSIRAIGIILITALLVIPASAASQLSNRLPIIIALGACIAIFSGIAGLYVSFFFNIPSGASIVFAAAVAFVAAVALSPRRKRDRSQSSA